MGWFIALGVIVLLAMMPVGVSVRYNAQGPYVGLIVGFVKLQIVPAKKKADKKEKTQKKKQTKQSAAPAQKPASTEKGGSLTDFIPLVRVILDLLIDFKRKIRVRLLELKITLAGGDPCDLAVNYGRAWAALGNLEPQLDRFFIIQKKDMQVQCDFEADTTLIVARLDLTITVGRLLRLVCCYGFRGIREYLKIMKSRKGGAVK